MVPELVSYILVISWAIEVFPAPVLPSIKTFWPALIFKSKLFKACIPECGYINPTLLNSILPSKEGTNFVFFVEITGTIDKNSFNLF